MNRQIKYTLALLAALLPGILMSQQFLTAGPDKETCEGKAVEIGPPDENPNLCYRWTPSTGLSCTDCPNPMASPKNDTEYTLHITDDDFSTGFSDVMEVTINFGDITFNSSFLKQGANEQVTATLNRHDGSSIIWGFEGDDLGCMIESSGANTAIITPGTSYGKLTITAKKSGDEECTAKGKIEVNAGVKDIEIVDVAQPGRKAKAGDTLYIITDPNVMVTAIPNSGETFSPPSSPDWHTPLANSVNVPDGTIVYNYAVPIGSSGAFTAGFGAPDYEPTTTVDLVVYHEQTIPHTNLLDIFNSRLTDKVKDKFKFPSVPGPPAPQLSVELILAETQLKISSVEKYNNPDTASKYEFDLNAGLTITGEIYHPVLTKTIAYPDILGGGVLLATKVGLAAIGEMSFSGGFEKDPSKENPDWRIKTTLTGDAFLQLRVQASITVPASDEWNAVAAGSASAKAGTKLVWDATNPNVLTLTPYVEPLFVEIDMYIQRKALPKDKRSIFPKQKWELLPKYISEPAFISLGDLF